MHKGTSKVVPLDSKQYSFNPNYTLGITQLCTNHCNVSTYGETIDAPTGVP